MTSTARLRNVPDLGQIYGEAGSSIEASILPVCIVPDRKVVQMTTQAFLLTDFQLINLNFGLDALQSQGGRAFWLGLLLPQGQKGLKSIAQASS